MAVRYLLDTNMVSELVRRPHGVVAQRVARVGEQAVCTSIVVSSEARFGARKSGSERLRDQVEAVLAALEVLPLDTPADHEYADLRHHLEQAGTLIGANDLLIAAHARALGLTVVTANDRGFRRVPGLTVENWLADTRPENA